MFYQPDYIVFLWIVPVFLLVILPLLWSFFGSLYRGYERSMLADVRGFIEIDERDTEDGEETDRRQYQRIRLDGGKACVDEYKGCCKAFVANISEQGICLKNIPRKMFLESGSFRLVFRTPQKDYFLMAKPRWKKMNGNRYMIGAELIKVPAGWKELNSSFIRSRFARAA